MIIKLRLCCNENERVEAKEIKYYRYYTKRKKVNVVKKLYLKKSQRFQKVESIYFGDTENNLRISYWYPNESNGMFLREVLIPLSDIKSFSVKE